MADVPQMWMKIFKSDKDWVKWLSHLRHFTGANDGIQTRLPFQEVRHGQGLEPGNIYLKHLTSSTGLWNTTHICVDETLTREHRICGQILIQLTGFSQNPAANQNWSLALNWSNPSIPLTRQWPPAQPLLCSTPCSWSPSSTWRSCSGSGRPSSEPAASPAFAAEWGSPSRPPGKASARPESWSGLRPSLRLKN